MNEEQASKFDDLMLAYKVEIDLLLFWPKAMIFIAKNKEWSMDLALDCLENDYQVFESGNKIAKVFKIIASL